MARFRAWLRVSETWITTVPSRVQRRPAMCLSRRFADSGNEGERAASKRSSTAVATLFTFCPPGPEARTNCSEISHSPSSMSGVIHIGFARVEDAGRSRGTAPPDRGHSGMKKGRRRGDPSECLGDGPVRDRQGRRPNQECLCEGSALQLMGLPTVRTPLSNIALDTGPPPFACFDRGEVGTDSAAVKLFCVLRAQFLDDEAKRHQCQNGNSKLHAPIGQCKRHPERLSGSEP